MNIQTKLTKAQRKANNKAKQEKKKKNNNKKTEAKRKHSKPTPITWYDFEIGITEKNCKLFN